MQSSLWDKANLEACQRAGMHPTAEAVGPCPDPVGGGAAQVRRKFRAKRGISAGRIDFAQGYEKGGAPSGRRPDGNKAHIGEVQSSLWDKENVEACEKAGITLL